MAAKITVKVQPRASRSRVAGRLGDHYKLQVAAPPVDGKANEACVQLLAGVFGVAPSAVRLVQGASAAIKRFEVDGITQRAAEARLEASLP